MKLICKNNKDHKMFNVSVRTVEEWFVDERGQWISTGDCVTSTQPTGSDDYQCTLCGEYAEVTL